MAVPSLSIAVSTFAEKCFFLIFVLLYIRVDSVIDPKLLSSTLKKVKSL
jgi:hypothetical protein